MALNVAVLGSGSGTNFEAIARYFDSPEKKSLVKIVCVISDIPDAYIIERARKRGIPANVIACRKFRTKLDLETEEKYVDVMQSHNTQLIVLAGFMRIVKKGILLAFPGCVINIHPALLPAFPGLKSWKQAYEYGVRYTGCTVHFVDEDIDTGPIIAQRIIEIGNNDSSDIVHEKIQEQEHDIYPRVIESIALGKVSVKGRRATRP